jgi:CheY-like chemotaxis protein
MVAVLLVDDVVVVRMTLRKILERGGHAVIECSGGNEAIGCLKSAHVDVVITDLWMPDGDGLEFIRKLKAAGSAIPVIAITGGAPRAPAEFSVEQAISAGANKVLMKPVGKDELLGVVAEAAGCA